MASRNCRESKDPAAGRPLANRGYQLLKSYLTLGVAEAELMPSKLHFTYL